MEMFIVDVFCVFLMLRHCPWPERAAIMKLEFSLTGARLNAEHIPVEISLLLQKVEQLLGHLEKGGRRIRKRERETEGSVIEYRTLCGIMKTWPPPGNPRWHCFEERSAKTLVKYSSKGNLFAIIANPLKLSIRTSDISIIKKNFIQEKWKDRERKEE